MTMAYHRCPHAFLLAVSPIVTLELVKSAEQNTESTEE